MKALSIEVKPFEGRDTCELFPPDIYPAPKTGPDTQQISTE